MLLYIEDCLTIASLTLCFLETPKWVLWQTVKTTLYFFFENYNLTSLDMYDGLSPVNESNVAMDDIAFHDNRFIDSIAWRYHCLIIPTQCFNCFFRRFRLKHPYNVGKIKCFLRWLCRRSIIALILNFMQIFANQKYS